MNTRLQHFLITLSLAATVLGCGTSSDTDPLVPEITSIEIDGTDINSSIHSIIIDTDQNQLGATVFYDDNSHSDATYELDWESNDTAVITVYNGLLTPVANRGAATISASYRGTLFTPIDKNVTIIPLIDVNITSDDVNISYADNNSTANVSTGSVYTLKANGTFDDDGASIMDISSNIEWTSSNTTIATIDAGLLTVYSVEGVVDINASVYNEINSTLELNVTIPRP